MFLIAEHKLAAVPDAVQAPLQQENSPAPAHSSRGNFPADIPLPEDYYIRPEAPRDLGTAEDPELEAFFSRTGAEILTSDDPRAYYSPVRDHIHMPPIDAQEVTRRVEVGAGNAALERQWLGQDLKAIAEKEGFDLSRADELEKAIDRLDQVHSDLGRLLADAEVLKDSGTVEIDRQESKVDRLPPNTADILSRMRDDPTADPFRNDLERETLRAELEELVGEEHSPDLAIGDETKLEEHMSDRLDRLYAAKAYLQSDAALANSVAMEHVLDRIANEEIDAQRARHVDANGEKGMTHG